MNNESKCCESCDGNLSPTYGNRCIDPSCKCHTPAPEDWEARFDEENFMLGTTLDGDSEELNVPKIKSFISRLLASHEAAARREGAERAVEYIEDYVDEALDSNTLSKMNWDALFRDARSEGVSG